MSFNPERRRWICAAAAGLAHAALRPEAALAHPAYPHRPITFICPWPAGGTADRSMRVLARLLGQALNQQVKFRNIAGATGMMGAHAIASARPDGYTIGQIPVSVVRFAQLGAVTFDPLRDLSYLARTSGQTFGIVVRDNSPYPTVAKLLDAARDNPGRMTYATAGLGGASHVGMEEFLHAANVRMHHVPFKGGAPALRDLLSGQVNVLCDSGSWADELVAGRLCLVATLGEERLKAFPATPTLKELGFPVAVDAPNGIGAPAGLHQDVAHKLRAALKWAVLHPEFRLACDRIHVPVMYQDADDYRQFILSQFNIQKRLIEELKLKDKLKRA